MATGLIGTIGTFDPKKEVIETYLARLDVWLAANKVDNADRVVTSLAVVGAEAFEVLQSECFPDKPATKSLKDIQDILTKYYHTPRNTMSERIQFRSRVQGEKESISDYLIALKRLAMSCDFREALESNLKEAFIHGLKDATIKKRMLTTEVNWAQMQTQAIAMEQVQKDVDPCPTSTVNKVTRHSRGSIKPRRGRGNAHGQWHQARQSSEACERCHGNHPSFACPFKHSWCHGCRRKGHIKSACRNKSTAIQSTDEQSWKGTTARRGHSRGGTRGRGSSGRGQSIRQVTEEQTEDLEIDAITNLRLFAVDAEGESANFMVDMTVENQTIRFAIDTQAAVTVVSEDTYKKYFRHCELLPVRGTLKSYSGHFIPVLGRIRVSVEQNDQIHQLNIVIVKGASKTSLLGRDWLTKLRMNWKQIFEAFSVTDTVQCNSIESVLEKHKQVFTRKSTHNTIKDFEVELKLKPDTKPVFMKARPVPYALKKAVEDNLTAAVNDGILEPVRTSKWASPVVIAPKADKSIRICGDYKRTVNQHLDDEVYPLPTANDIFSTLAGGTVFTKLDLSNAYQQIALSEEAKQLMTINTHKGLFRYKRLPYGIKVAPAIFQSVMDQILAGLEGVCCFIDDILITSKDMGTHVKLLDQVLQRLEEYGVLVKKEKCAFAVSHVDYLGHSISGNGIRPNNDKVKAIQAVATPRNVSELKSFLGAVTFYHKFLPNFATICCPLYQLTRTGVKWVWTRQCTKAMNTIKSMLASDLVLAHYDPTLSLKVASDASPHGVGAVLAVVDSHGFERPVAYASRTLTSAERNYSQLEREAVGIMFAIKRFHKYIYGRQFILVTDNKPLTSIFSPSKDIPTLSALRLQRWALALMAHNYTIEFRRTEDHGNVDMLSRFPDPDGEEETELPINHFSYLEDLPVTSAEVRKETATDPVLSKVVRYVMHGWPAASEIDESLVPYQRRKNELSLETGCLLWGMRVVIPGVLRQRVLDDLHHEHTGIVRMKMLARSYCWFPNIDDSLEKMSKQCESCAVHANAPPAATTVSWPTCSQAFERVHVDFGTLDDKDLLILVDVYSKWIEVAVMSNTTASQTIGVLRSWFARFGIPRELVSDNGPQFTAELFTDFMRCNGVKHTLIPPYSPQTNGSAEKSVQVVKSILKKQVAEQTAGLGRTRTFNQRLDDFLITYRSTPTTATGVSPAERFFGRKIRTRLSLLRPEDKVRFRPQSDSVREFSDGDLVWVRNLGGRPKWVPGEVVRREGLLKYEVYLGNRSRLVHVDHLMKRSTLLKNQADVNEFQEPEGSCVNVPKVPVENVPIVRVPNRAPIVNVPNIPSVRGSVPTTPSASAPNTPMRSVPSTPVKNMSSSPITNARMTSPVRRYPARNRQAPARLIEQM